MTRETKSGLWGLAVASFPVAATITALIVAAAGGTPNQGGVLAMIVATLAAAVVTTIIARLPVGEARRVAPGESPAPVSADMARQIHGIVNSGNEPALIVEELRRLTEEHP